MATTTNDLLSRPLDRRRMAYYDDDPKDLCSLVLKTIRAYPARFTVDSLERYFEHQRSNPIEWWEVRDCIHRLDADLGALTFSHDGRLSISPTRTA